MDDLLVHVIIIGPVIRWLTHQERSWNKKSVYIGVLMAVGVLMTMVIEQFNHEADNLYVELGVSASSSRSEIQSTYRRLSFKYHPDRNSDPEARVKFDKIREAQEILANDEKRRVYNRFGDFSKKGTVGTDQFLDVVFVSMLHVFIPFIFGFLYTYDTDSQAGRKVFMGYLGLSFSLELLLRFGNQDDCSFGYIPLYGKLLPFEKVKALRGMIPAVLNGVLLLSSTLCVNCESLVEQILKSVLASHFELVAKFDELLAISANQKEINPEIQAEILAAIGDLTPNDSEDVWEKLALNAPKGLRRELKRDILTATKCRDSSWRNTAGRIMMQKMQEPGNILQRLGSAAIVMFIFLASVGFRIVSSLL